MLSGHGQAHEESKDYVKIRVRRKIDFHFINVDLELEASENIQPLVHELSENTVSLYCGDIDEMANLELSLHERSGVDFYDSYNDEKDLIGGVDIHISAFCDLIENLSVESRRIWDNCHRKEFDIGFQTGNTAKSFRTQIRPETIVRCAKLGASVEITVYPHFNYEIRRKEGLQKN